MGKASKTVTITPDLGVSSVGSKTFLDNLHTAKMRCDCTWVEKATLKEAEGRATRHLIEKHNGGKIHFSE